MYISLFYNVLDIFTYMKMRLTFIINMYMCIRLKLYVCKYMIMISNIM